jgi:hypothetical protein
MAKRLCDPTSGKIGLQVYQGGRNGQVVRTLAIPTNPRTSDQSLARAHLLTASKAWDTITANQRAAWWAAAANVQTRSRLGMSGQITGNQLFVKVNVSRLTIGGTILETPPADATFSPLPVTALVITNTGGTIALSLTTTDAPPDGTMLRAAPPVKAGVNRCPGLNVLGTLDSPVANAINITSVYTAAFGVPAVGRKVFVAVNSNINGWQDLPVVLSATVPTAS